MDLFWTYDDRSSKALKAFEETVRLKRETLEKDGLSTKNEWSRIFEKESSLDSEENKTILTDCVQVNRNEDKNKLTESIESIPQITHSEDVIKSIEKQLATVNMQIDEENYEELCDQFMEELKCGYKEGSMEDFFSHKDHSKIMELFSGRITDTCALNFCDMFFKSNICDIVDNQEELLKHFILPIILKIGYTKHIEHCLFKCLSEIDYKLICFHLFLPLLLSDTCPFIFSNLIDKLNEQTRSHMLCLYFKECKLLYPWVFPTILSLIKSLDIQSLTNSLFESIVFYLKMGSDNFKTDLNFAKIIHTALTFIKKYEILLNTDLINVLQQIVLINETPFKNSCSKMLTLDS